MRYHSVCHNQITKDFTNRLQQSTYSFSNGLQNAAVYIQYEQSGETQIRSLSDFYSDHSTN